MPPIWNDIASLLPQSWIPTSTLPSVGSPAPVSSLNLTGTAPTIVAMVRHCGCPFAQNEVEQLVKLSNEKPALQVVIVCMAEEEDAKAWFARIGGNGFQDPSRVTLVADPTRAVYAGWGLGSLSFTALFSKPMMVALGKLRNEGTVNTATVSGSNRWQNSGGFAVKAGKVTWLHEAVHAGDMCDYAEGVDSLAI